MFHRSSICAATLLFAGSSFSQEQVVIPVSETMPMEFVGLSPAVSELPFVAVPEPARGKPREKEDRAHEREARERLHRQVNPNALPHGIDPALQTDGPLYATDRALDLSVDGQLYTSVVPADPNLAVGPNHVIQMINNSNSSYFRIYDKSLNALVAQSLLTTVTGIGGDGDPVVMYDALADRWLMSEFGSSGNRFVIAVSQTANPTGSWYIYNFTTPNFPDYPKYAVWHNMYIVTSNENSPAIYALPRANMLAGLAGTTVRFTVSSYPTIGFQSCTPVNFCGGSAPPAGAPGMFMRMADDAWTTGIVDRLEIWNINYNAVTPASSTITGPSFLPTAAFDTGLCGYTSFSCIDQPGTNINLDPLREVLMNHIQYRNLSGYEAIVCNHVTDVTGGDLAGVRWYELHRTGGIGNAWSIYQQGTYSPAATTERRWMASIAINQNGDIGLSYNVSGPSTYPSIRYTGRYAGDPLGQMTIAETSIVAGTTYSSTNRWGDYGSLDVDPADGLSFYGTLCYNPTTSWRTRMYKFSFSPQSVNVSPKVFLEGPYAGGSLMNDDLRSAGVIPATEPFTAAGYTFVGGGGETAAASVFTTTGNNAIVDWVIVELRDPANSANIVASRAALLQRDGDVVGTNGTSAVTINKPPGSYFVAIRHRNHLGVMATPAVTLSASTTVVDLTSAGTATYGTNARKDIGGTMVLWAGDVTFDRTIKYTGSANDRDPILVRVGGTVPTATVAGYYPEDVNMSGVVKYTGSANDRDPILVNVGGSIPTATRGEQLP